MGSVTRIEWCDSAWNPVTGCLHGCGYCYARRVAERFGARGRAATSAFHAGHPCAGGWRLHELDYPLSRLARDPRPAGAIGWPPTPGRGRDPYPFGFDPTLYRYRLGQPGKWKKPRTVFVCSMADLFGDWVPDGWIREVFGACDAAPWHRYVFLTKNPARYCDLHRKGLLPDAGNYWFGATFDHCNWTGQEDPGRPATFSLLGETIHDAGDYYFPVHPKRHRIVCFEPLLRDLGPIGSIGAEWVIIGAETGNRKGKAKPQKEWVDAICGAADREGAAVFMKDSLVPIMGEGNMRRELPW